MSRISIHYDEAIAMARGLQRAAEDLNRTNSAIASAESSNLKGGWEGEAAQAYFGESHNWWQENRELANELLELSNTIKRVAQEIKEADEKLATETREISLYIEI